MTDITERLRGWREVPGMTCPPFLGEAADEIERLRRADEWHRTTIAERDAEIERLRERIAELEDPHYLKSLHAEIERMRAALRQIVTEADSDDGLTAWDGADIARRALWGKAP